MSWLNPLSWGNSAYDEPSEYDRGYDAADEFLDLVDEDITDEQARAHWGAVEAHHSEEYITGYAECIMDNAQPWWKFW
jgi:hypothetical protein